MRQQWIPKSTKDASPRNDGHVTQEVDNSTISNLVSKGELELHYQDHIQTVPIGRKQRSKLVSKIQKDH